MAIPYAEPPIGDLRFSEPVEYKPKSSDTVLGATNYGAICPQFFDEILVKTVTPLTRNMSEDCLTLNIWAPRLPNKNNVVILDKKPNPKSTNNLWTILTEETLDFEEDDPTNSTNNSTSRKSRQYTTDDNLLPVMVWLHGGGFSMGSTALDEYDGSILSSYGNVIVVTINYRLGVFGFFNLNAPEATGNQGLKDQVMALQWIKKHIRHFGGDPKRITIFGQSAGGFAVGLHLISPNAKVLFTRAILQSGSPLVFDQFYGNTYNIAKRLVEYVDCAEDNELESSDNPQADNSTEVPTNEEDNEEHNNEEDNAKSEEKFHSVVTALDSEVRSNFNGDEIVSVLNRRKRAEEEGDEDGEEDDDEKTESTSSNSTTVTESSSTFLTSVSTSDSTSSFKSITKFEELTTLSSLSTTTTSIKTTTESESDDEDEVENKNESKSSSISSTESSSTITTGASSNSTTTEKSVFQLRTEKTFFTGSSVSSTTLSPLLNKKSIITTTEKTPKNTEDDLKKANKILKCMQSKSMKTLIKAQKNAMQNSMFPFSPNKHDSILPKMPGEVIKQDASAIFFHSNVEQVLLGVNKDEGSLYLHLTMPHLFPSENLTLNINRLSDLRSMLATNLTNAFKIPRAQAIIVANLLLSNGPEIDTTENLVKKYYQLIADLMFNCPTVMLADELVKLNYQDQNDSKQTLKKKQVYFYRFNERPSVSQWGEWMGITHHEEVQFVFGMPLKYPLKYNSKDLIFSKRIMKTWAHFAKTGEMLPQLELQWPAYNKHQQLMELSAFDSKLTEKLHEKNCNLFRIGFESFMRRRKRFVL